ncbi:MAG: hypothetical protein KGL39_38985 [Patescibacteria group bacterium]|nr:hypothetical protein [Patescibacteria group bacterium]
MDLSKYTGELPDGEFTAKITSVTAHKAQKDDSDYLRFQGDIPELELTNKILFNASLKPGVLARLKDNLEAAEALREGDQYGDSAEELASDIQTDLSDRYVRIQVKPGKNGYKDVKIVGLDTSAV